MEKNNIHQFLDKIRTIGGAVWLKHMSIKMSLPKSFDDGHFDAFIVHHRSAIIQLLQENNIQSKEDFLQRVIFRDSTITNYPLSYSMEGIWFVESFERGTNAYLVPTLFRVSDRKYIAGIRFALGQLVSRHEILRTTIHLDAQGKGVQLVGNRLLSIDEAYFDNEQKFESQVREDCNRPIDLSAQYPLRVKIYYTLFEKKTDQIFILINFHHIATDGWSGKIFEKELATYFDAYQREDRQTALSDLDIQYKEYSLWQRNSLTGSKLKEQTEYWANVLAGYQPLELPVDYARASKFDYKGARQNFSFDGEISSKTLKLAQQYGVTLQSIFLGVLGILLEKYCGQDDIVILSPIANRTQRQTEGLLGCFVNTLVNRIQLQGNESFAALIGRIHEGQILAHRYQDLPFEKLVSTLFDDRDPGSPPLFPVLLAVQGTGELKGIDSLADVLTPFRLENIHEPARVEMAIYIDDTNDLLSGTLIYATSIFSAETIQHFVGNFVDLLHRTIEQPMELYNRSGLLENTRYLQMITRGNCTGNGYYSNKTIHGLFEEQAARTPDALALVYDDRSMTYRELNERSNQLAREVRNKYLRKTGVPMASDTLIGLYLDRGIEMVIGMLAILKAGGAYVPMDISYPAARVNYMLEDTNALLILSERKRSAALAAEAIYVDCYEQVYQHHDCSNLSGNCCPNDLAYVIYTSGTTGKPKGVLVEHAGVVNLAYGQNVGFEIKEKSRVLQFAAFVFDAAVSEIFTALSFGGTLYIISTSVRQDANLLVEYLGRHKITVATIPPAMLSAMPYQHLPDLKVVVVAGELCPLDVMQKWSAGRKLINAYGPTEATVCATMHFWKSGSANSDIGKPIDNIDTYILDKYGNSVPVGAKGELYIAGISLARGYLNDVQLTVDRFIENKFVTAEGSQTSRFYKTGDLVRCMAEGNYDFIGRNDSQVKIRGHRIELDEIEQQMLTVNGVKQCCVIAKDRKTASGSIKYLVGYYTLNDPNNDALDEDVENPFDYLLPRYMQDVSEKPNYPSKESILEQLKLNLPDYMIPDTLLVIDSIPVTINGKIDKDALPEPEFNIIDDYVPPVSEMEKLICNMWREILSVNQIGTMDDFFKLGGNSILAIQTSHRMSKELGCDIKVADIFRLKTISCLLQFSVADRAGANDTGEQWELII